MKNVATKVEGEKLLSLYHPFDTQMNEGMNNAVSRRCPKNKVFSGSGGLKYRVASVAGQKDTRSHKIQLRCIQTMWNENVPTARILLETEGKAMERWCSLESAIQSEKETKRKNSCCTI